jgi:diadenosine tetraphosphatase ApaH/serine/threonine PP2A family protein phosphatase
MTALVPHDDLDLAVQGLALRWRRANGPAIALMNRLGQSIEEQLRLLPAGARAQIDAAVRQGLLRAFAVTGQTSRLRPTGGRGTLAAVMATGAAGGAGGLPTAIAELPFTITVFLHAIRREAEAAGLDPEADWVRAECLQVFAAGSPLATDDGVNTSFIGARMALNGPALQRLISAIVPRLGLAMGQKLAAQAVPVVGAVAGAGLNAAYLSYYREIARIRFQLLRLSERHGAAPTLAAFAAATGQPPITRAVSDR